VSLSTSDRDALLAVARRVVVGTVTGQARDDASEPSARAVSSPGAAFVTLFVAGKLRGCIGTSEQSRPLDRVVADMARAAATRDWRFPALSRADLDHLTIEISVLSPERRIHGPGEIEIGRDGLDVRRGRARGLLLPQVAVDHGFDGERFLAETCRKADLPADAWRDPDTDVRAFEAEVFGSRSEP